MIIAAESILMIISGLSAPLDSKNDLIKRTAHPGASSVDPSIHIAADKSASPIPRRSVHSLRKFGNKSHNCMNMNQKPDTMSKKNNIYLSSKSVFIVLTKTAPIDSFSRFGVSFAEIFGSLKRKSVMIKLNVVTIAAL